MKLGIAPKHGDAGHSVGTGGTGVADGCRCVGTSAEMWGQGSLLASSGLVPWPSGWVDNFTTGALISKHHLRHLSPLPSLRLQWDVQAVRLRLAPPEGDGERVPLPRLPGQHGGCPLRALQGGLLPPAGGGLLPALPLPPPGYVAACWEGTGLGQGCKGGLKCLLLCVSLGPAEDIGQVRLWVPTHRTRASREEQAGRAWFQVGLSGEVPEPSTVLLHCKS